MSAMADTVATWRHLTPGMLGLSPASLSPGDKPQANSPIRSRFVTVAGQRHAFRKLFLRNRGQTGTPTDIRERYRLRFGIETSYRQMRQARIYTCTRNPLLRLFFLAVALILRNIWVWLHQECFAEGPDDNPTLRLELLRFKRMLEWIVYEVVALYHDNSPPYVTWQQLSLT